MRSISGLVGSIGLLAGVALAFAAGIAINKGASEIIHLALGLSFLLFAYAVFDFRLPSWFNLVVRIALLALAAIFLLQLAADLTQAETIRSLAYGALAQGPERLLGDVFLLWCIVMVILDSRGATRWLGIVAVVIAVVVEIYFYVQQWTGGVGDERLKLLLLLLFVWLALESLKPKTA